MAVKPQPVMLYQSDARNHGLPSPVSDLNPLAGTGGTGGTGTGGAAAPTAYPPPTAPGVLLIPNAVVSVAPQDDNRLAVILENRDDVDLEYFIVGATPNNAPGQGLGLPATPQPLAVPSAPAVAVPGAGTPFSANGSGALGLGSTNVYRVIPANDYGIGLPSPEASAVADASGVLVLKSQPVAGASHYYWVGRVANTGLIFGKSTSPWFVDFGKFDMSLPGKECHATPTGAIPTVNTSRPRTSAAQRPQLILPTTAEIMVYNPVPGTTKKVYVATIPGPAA